jgi:SAM-dependent methyltransferase
VEVPVRSALPLIHVGSNDSFSITTEGRRAATLLLNALEEKDPKKARAEAKESSGIYTKIIPRENYGGEYSALQWFDDYIDASPDERPKFLKDPQVKFFFGKFSAKNYALLREFLIRKYRIRDIGDEETKNGQDRKIWLEDTILFENPRRETWEHTSKFMKLVEIRPGFRIGDLGGGPGYYSFRFAKKVGPTGVVYDIDTDADHLRWVEQAKIAMGVTNVQTVQTGGSTLGLVDAAGKLDIVFLCSLYHNIYGMTTQPERDQLVASIRNALKPDGRLYLADNGLVKQGTLPYHGPYIARELIIAQMRNYGFDLIHNYQPIPQRYLLVFKKRPEPKSRKSVVAQAKQSRKATQATKSHKANRAKKSRKANRAKKSRKAHPARRQQRKVNQVSGNNAGTNPGCVDNGRCPWRIQPKVFGAQR